MVIIKDKRKIPLWRKNEVVPRLNFPCKLSDLSFTFFQWCVIIHNVFGSNLDAKKNPWRKKRNLPDSLYLTILGCFISIRRYLKATPIYEFPFCRTLGRKSGNVDDTQCGNFRISLSFRYYVKSILVNQEVVKLPFLLLRVLLIWKISAFNKCKNS